VTVALIVPRRAASNRVHSSDSAERMASFGNSSWRSSTSPFTMPMRIRVSTTARVVTAFRIEEIAMPSAAALSPKPPPMNPPPVLVAVPSMSSAVMAA
jgi:hypothetical protein